MSAMLDVSRLCKFFGGIKAINDQTLSVQAGQFLGVIGANGAGKTT